MKKPPFLDVVRSETLRAREALATIAYDLETVRREISRASGEGVNEITLALPRPLDLRSTSAAQHVVKYLTDCGFRVDWSSRSVDRDGGRLTTYDLHITWPVGL